MRDGGRAFPVPGLFAAGWHDGMSLRDYFAAAALQAILSSPHTDGNGDNFRKEVAKASFQMADAMISARKQRDA